MKRWFRYERRHEDLAPRNVLFGRLAASSIVSVLVILVSLAGGTTGYHWTERLPWIDALLNASMILGGMGPVDPVRTTGGKRFASAYALYCGVVILLTVGLMMAPAAHRGLHPFHLESERSAGAE